MRSMVGAILMVAAVAPGFVFCAEGGDDVIIENARLKLTIGSNARAKSLVVKATGDEMLDLTEDIPAFSVVQDRPFNNEVKLLLANKRTEFRADRIRREGNFLYVGFEFVSYEAKIAVTERPGYILFEIVDFPLGPKGANGLDMTYPPVDVMRILNLPVRDREHFGDWLNVCWDADSAVSLFAAEPYTWIDNVRRNGFRLMTAEAHRDLNLYGATAVLIASATPAFLDCMDVAERELGLPRGVESRRDKFASASSYWTCDISPENVDKHIALAKKGGFRNMLIYHTAVCDHGGDYIGIADYEPNKKFTKGYASIREMLAKIKAAGISPGLHVLQTFIGFNKHYISPVADPRLNLKSYFTLLKPLSADETGDVYVQENPVLSPTNDASRILYFGGELMHYEGFTVNCPYKFTGVTRGYKKTTVTAHRAGQIGGILDVCEFGARSCYINQRTDLQDEIAEKIAKIWDCGFEFMYNDGSEGVNVPHGIHVANAQYRVWKQLGSKPRFVAGAARSHFGWHHQAGGNAFDVFPPEKFKDMIVRWPLYEAPIMAQDFTRIDFGWWAVVLPSEKTIGTQPDMWEFGTSKAAAWNCPATVQMNIVTLEKHPRGADLLEVMRRWEDVRERHWLTEEQRDALKDPKREFHLYKNESGEYELCEIKMLPAYPKAPQLRGFVFERCGRRVIAYWHTCGSGRISVAFGENGCESILEFGGLRYLDTGLSCDGVLPTFSEIAESKNLTGNESLAR